MVTFQEIIMRLHTYWSSRGCVLVQPYFAEVGAATLHPITVFGCLRSSPCFVAYVQPVIRPADARSAESSNRLYQHHQYQVIIKPSPSRLQDLYLDSLRCLGFSLQNSDIRFVCDDWENPSIGASGLGWEVWCDGMEISQFTYMQQIGGLECNMVPGELAYGLERIAMYLQGVDSVQDIRWNEDVIYGSIFARSEREFTLASFECYGTDSLFSLFSISEDLCVDLLKQNLPLVAYDQCLKANHLLNLLDSRGVLGIVERASYILKIRKMVKGCCDLYVSMESNNE